MSPKHKKPSFNESVAAGKQPRAVENPDEYKGQTPLWCFKRVLLSGDYRWSSMHDENVRVNVYNGLSSYGTMLWSEIEGKKSCHPFEIDELTGAIKTAMMTRCQGIESGYQLRVSAKGRILGIRTGRVMSIVLWDEEHEAFPTAKKNT